MVEIQPSCAALRSILADATTWSREVPVPPSWIVGSALGMGIPIAVGAAIGRTDLGMLASIGGLAVSGAGGYGTLREQSVRLSYALIAGTLAILIGSAMGGHGWITGAAVVIATILAALIGGFGRTVARYSSVFIVFVVIGTGVNPAGVVNPAGATFIFITGAIWTMMVSLLASGLFRVPDMETIPEPGTIPGRQSALLPFKNRWRRWSASLFRPAGWHYPLRIGLCMLAAEIVAVLWGQQQSYWIALVVAIVVQRSFETTSSRVFQRTIGTFAGVLAVSFLLLWSLPIGLLVLVVMILAALRPLLKVRNYALYSAVMTPLVLILLEFGKPMTPEIISYRLIDTVIGLSIGIILGYHIWPAKNSPSPPSKEETVPN
jgi:uncharacterized membrane protein YccC